MQLIPTVPLANPCLRFLLLTCRSPYYSSRWSSPIFANVFSHHVECLFKPWALTQLCQWTLITSNYFPVIPAILSPLAASKQLTQNLLSPRVSTHRYISLLVPTILMLHISWEDNLSNTVGAPSFNELSAKDQNNTRKLPSHVISVHVPIQPFRVKRASRRYCTFTLHF